MTLAEAGALYDAMSDEQKSLIQDNLERLIEYPGTVSIVGSLIAAIQSAAGGGKELLK